MSPPLKNEDWRDIAAQTSKENDPNKLVRLIGQLCESLDDRDRSRKEQQARNAA